MTDDIQKVREAYNAALEECSRFSAPAGTDFYTALAKRLQPRPEPVKKVWSVSPGLADRYEEKTAEESKKSVFVWHRRGRNETIAALNAIAPDIIRERPDLVAAEWWRRVEEYDRMIGYHDRYDILLRHRRILFPELDP